MWNQVGASKVRFWPSAGGCLERQAHKASPVVDQGNEDFGDVLLVLVCEHHRWEPVSDAAHAGWLYALRMADSLLQVLGFEGNQAKSKVGIWHTLMVTDELDQSTGRPGLLPQPCMFVHRLKPSF